MFGQWTENNRIKLEEDKDGEFDELMYINKQTLISMLKQEEKGINSLMQSRKKWKNRYYKIRKQLKDKNKELEMLKDIKEIAESKVGELSPVRISKNKSTSKQTMS